MELLEYIARRRVDGTYVAAPFGCILSNTLWNVFKEDINTLRRLLGAVGQVQPDRMHIPREVVEESPVAELHHWLMDARMVHAFAEQLQKSVWTLPGKKKRLTVITEILDKVLECLPIGCNVRWSDVAEGLAFVCLMTDLAD